MGLEVLTVPCLADNYAYLVHDSDSGETALIDVPEALPILTALAQNGWRLDKVFITHHHWDHVEGLESLLEHHKPAIFGAKADAHRLPALDVALSEGDTVTIGAHEGKVLDVSGHTLGHIAFCFEEARLAFTADSLMALGCGRLFEGTPAQMWASMKKLMAMPADTLVCSGHEYTQGNAKFALTIEPDNVALKARAKRIDEARAKGEATVPSLLSEEIATNPFLRANLPEVKAAVDMNDAPAEDVFAEIRGRKDKF